MTGSSQGSPATDALFTDALAGFDGTAAPPPVGVDPHVFSDPLLAPFAGAPAGGAAAGSAEMLLPEVPLPDLPQVEVPRIEVPRIEARAPEDWGSDLQLGSTAGSSAHGGTSADRARAAREAMQTKRDAALGQRSGKPHVRPGLAPARPAGRAPEIVASARDRSMPARYPAPDAPTGVMNVPAGPMNARTRIESFARSGQAPAPGPQGWPPPQGWPSPQGWPAPQGPTPGPAPQRQPNPGMSSYPQQRPAPSRPARGRPTQRKSGAGWGALFALMLFLVVSGVGRQLLDGLLGLFQQ